MIKVYNHPVWFMAIYVHNNLTQSQNVCLEMALAQKKQGAGSGGRLQCNCWEQTTITKQAAV